MRRANNQDSHAVLPAESPERFATRGHLFVVADGMGAHVAGELASSMATESISMNYFRPSQLTASDALCNSVHEANAEIHDRGQKNPEFHNMGTTCSSLALLAEGAVISHVGDSRVYRLRGNTFEQLTFDHSLVWEMEASGQIHPDSVLGQSIPKNVITRSLGPSAEVAVDVEGPFPIRPGDVFLLCSDGLSGLVTDVEIGALIGCLTEEKAVRVLVDLANLRGGPDNSTVVVVRASDDWQFSGNNDSETSPHSYGTKFSPLLAAATGACLLGAVGLGFAQSWGPMIVAIILGVIALVATIIQAATNSDDQSKGVPQPSPNGGQGPYRRYNAKPSAELSDSLGATVAALRDASVEKKWAINWTQIDQYQTQAAEAISSSDPRKAVQLQAEAILETMDQLREQHNRSASETAIE